MGMSNLSLIPGFKLRIIKVLSIKYYILLFPVELTMGAHGCNLEWLCERAFRTVIVSDNFFVCFVKLLHCTSWGI